MHKRGYIRISQDEKPWLRITPESDSENDSFKLLNKKTVRWTSGTKRDRETRILNAYSKAESKKLMLQAFKFDQNTFTDEGSDEDELSRRLLHLSHKSSKLHRFHAISKSKNNCFFSGKSRTFNRQLLVSRQVLRSLTRFGLISGLISGKRG